jgi:hypothetical protein
MKRSLVCPDYDRNPIGKLPAPADRHYAILCELAEISETLRESICA